MRFLIILFIGLFFQTASFAQIDSKEMQDEMEKMTKELQEQLKNFNFEDFPIDSALLKNFNFPEGFNAENFVMPNDIDMNGLMKMMEKQMSQLDIEGIAKMMEENMSKIDFAEMEKMMEPFMKGEFFALPIPEGNQEQKEGEKQATPKEEKKQKKKKKKQKTYKM